MNIEELNSIISKGENSRTEFKEAGEMVPVGFYQTVVSFLNHEGGVILLGVDDNGMEKGSSWTEKGARLRNARINKINKLQFDDFQKGSSWAEKGVKLLPKRTLAMEQKYVTTEKGRLFLGGFEIN